MSLVYVVDTAAHIVQSLASLATIFGNGKLGGVQITDGPVALNLTAAQYTNLAPMQSLVTGSYTLAVTGVLAADAAFILAAQPTATVTISDTAASIQSAIDTLDPLVARITSLLVTGEGIPSFVLTPAQDVADAAIMAKIVTPYALTVSAASAGAANRTISGLSATANTLTGSVGNDTFVLSGGTNIVNGGAGFNVVRTNLASTAASLLHNLNGSWTLTAGGSTSTLTGIDQVQYTDKTVATGTVATFDFLGTGTSSILTQDQTGALSSWTLVNGVAQVGENTYIGSTVGFWHYVTTGDFFGTGNAGVLVEDTAGDLVAWNVQAGKMLGQSFVGTATNGWSYAAAGDFNGDGTTDLLLQNGSGVLVTWSIANGQLSGAPQYLTTLTAGQIVVGTGDFSGDGRTAVLLEGTDGALSYVEQTDGVTVAPAVFIGAAVGGWSFLDTGDLNGDGTTDILLKYTDNSIESWMIKNGSISSKSYIGTMTGDWSFAGIADLNGDGTSDVIAKNAVNGGVAGWEIKNGVLDRTVGVGSIAEPWSLLTTHG